MIGNLPKARGGGFSTFFKKLAQSGGRCEKREGEKEREKRIGKCATSKIRHRKRRTGVSFLCPITLLWQESAEAVENTLALRRAGPASGCS